MQKKIDISKNYCFPKDISIINHKDKFLVITPATANWIVLESDAQLKVFIYLKDGHSINEALNEAFNNDDVTYVVTQIEARNLCKKQVHNTTDEERCLHLYLTNRCNLSCPHCYMFSGKANENELSTSEILKLLHDYKHIAKGKRIILSGGEPTIHQDFEFILKEAYNMGLEIRLMTNGSLLTEECVNRISQYLISVQISIDGYSEETNRQIRGRGQFQKALDVVDAFVRTGIETSVAITPSMYSLSKHIDDYAFFAMSLSEKYKDANFIVKFSEGVAEGRNISLSKTQNKQYSELILEIERRIFGEQYELMTFVDRIGNNAILNNCMFGVFAIASNGDAYLCAEIGSQKSIGNIRNVPFETICLEAASAESVTSVSNLRPCNTCDIRFICGGGCRIHEFPDLTKVKSFRDLNHTTISPRVCELEIKNKFYDLMIESNEYLFVAD